MSYAALSFRVDLITICALALALIALLLLWRQYTLRAAAAALQARLQQESAHRAHAEQALAEVRSQLGQLSASVQSVKDSERRRIGRDLHDDLGQHLLALTFDTNTLAARHPALKQPLAEIEAHLRLTLRSLRSVVRDLMPEALEAGLRGAVQQQVEQFSRLSGIPCRLEAEPEVFSAAPDPRLDLALYRILQESLSNIARHAQASQVWIALCRQAGSVSLTVRDNGVGLPHRPARRGCGLQGIAQRVAEAGGRIQIASLPGQGTALTMSFPLDVATHQMDTRLPAAQ